MKDAQILQAYDINVYDTLDYTDIIEYSANVTIQADGETKYSDFTTGGSINFLNEDGSMVFKLPEPFYD